MDRHKEELKIAHVIDDNVICIDKSCCDATILSKEIIVSPYWLAKRIYREMNASPSDNNDFKKVCPHCQRKMSQEEYMIHVCSKKVIAEKLGKPSQES